MIAVCPSCHDEIHHGNLIISDDILYKWKGIERNSSELRDHLYVEPAREQRILAGSITLQSKNPEQIVFQLSNTNEYSFRVQDAEILLLDSKVTTLGGRNSQSQKNYVKMQKDDQVNFARRPGKISISVPAIEDYVPSWVVYKMQIHEPTFASNGQVTALDIEVIEPGTVRVQGLWVAPEVTIVITESKLSIVSKHLREPISMVGHPEGTVLIFTGPVTSAMFRFS